MGTDVRDGSGTTRVINWCGCIVQDPHPAVRALGFLPDEGHGVYVARYKFLFVKFECLIWVKGDYIVHSILTAKIFFEYIRVFKLVCIYERQQFYRCQTGVQCLVDRHSFDTNFTVSTCEKKVHSSSSTHMCQHLC